MANPIDYTEEDKVRVISAYDLARILIQAFGSTDVAGIKLLGKKSDGSFEVIKTDDAGSLSVKESTPLEMETEWTSTPVAEQVASAAATNLTKGSITPTFPTGVTAVRVILIAGIHAANQAGNTHHIGIKVQGQKAAGGYTDLLDLTATTPLALTNTEGSGDGLSVPIDVSALVDESAVQYDFRIVVDSDNAGAVNYTSYFALILIYRI
jgi:hypothetical protein